MSTFSDYNTLIEGELANTSDVFYTEEVKRQAANDAVEEIIREYTVAEFIKKPSGGTLTFASGKADFPSDYFRMVKLWEKSATGIQQNEYTYVVPDIWDKLADSASFYWTEDYDEDDGTRKLFIKPTTKTSIYCRYIKKPTLMEDDVTDSGLSSDWDECVAYLAIKRLFRQAGRYDEAREWERIGDKKKAETYLALRDRGGVKENNVLKSKFNRVSLLGRTGQYNNCRN